MILTIGTMGAFYAGNRVNVLDICPNYTASLLGLVNGVGAIAGIVAIFLTGLLTPNVNLLHFIQSFDVCNFYIFFSSKLLTNGEKFFGSHLPFYVRPHSFICCGRPARFSLGMIIRQKIIGLEDCSLEKA